MESIRNTLLYLWNGIKRIFSPSDDNYPPTGVQPFKGEPYDENKQRSL